MSNLFRSSWPELSDVEVIGPEAILQHHASLLSEATGGRLQGKVAKTSADDRIVFGMLAVAPTLGEKVKLFECLQQVADELLYPVLIVPPKPIPSFLKAKVAVKGKSPVVSGSTLRHAQNQLETYIGIPDREVSNPWLATDPNELADKLEDVMHSPEVKAQLLALLKKEDAAKAQDTESAVETKRL